MFHCIYLNTVKRLFFEVYSFLRLSNRAFKLNMRKIKTIKDFENIFYEPNCGGKYTDYIYIFEEFDCIQGAFLSRDLKTEDDESKNISKIDTLTNKKLNLINELSRTAENTVKIEYQKLIDEITTEIDTEKNKLTLDTLLTVFDGPIEMRGRVVVITTNYIDRLDPRLTRTGRFDICLELTPFNSDEIKELLLDMYKDKLSEEDIEKIQNTIFIENKYTPSDVRSIVVGLRDLNKVLEKLSK